MTGQLEHAALLIAFTFATLTVIHWYPDCPLLNPTHAAPRYVFEQRTATLCALSDGMLDRLSRHVFLPPVNASTGNFRTKPNVVDVCLPDLNQSVSVIEVW